ncbi:hypothetical protein IJM86_01150 [bacterium]|nr:hypothetical protein [bacterium]
MVTGDCNFIKSQGSTKRNLSGLQILDKELTGTLETLVTTGIKEIKQIYNIRTGQVETCQKNFNDSRKSQKTDCTSNFDSVCVNWADQTWS